jgi:molecular chaperone HscB
VNLQSSDFELFGLPARFAQARPEIDQRWKDLQREMHPDRFVAQGAAAQRLAMQWSVRINEAYQRLKDPLKRAAYLCELRGAAVNAENNTAMPASFLMQQIAWREALDDAASTTDFDALEQQIQDSRRTALQACATLLDEQADAAGAVQQVRALMFIERFSADLQVRQDRFEAAQRGQ